MRVVGGGWCVMLVGYLVVSCWCVRFVSACCVLVVLVRWNERTYEDRFPSCTMVPIMVSSVGKAGQMKGMTVETYISDYQEVEGLMIPMFMDMKINGTTFSKLTMTGVDINGEVDQAIFELK